MKPTKLWPGDKVVLTKVVDGTTQKATVKEIHTYGTFNMDVLILNLADTPYEEGPGLEFEYDSSSDTYWLAPGCLDMAADTEFMVHKDKEFTVDKEGS